VKLYHLFCHNPYEAQGADDYCQSYETLKDAQDGYTNQYEKFYYYAEVMKTKSDGSLVAVSQFIERLNGGREWITDEEVS
jgi:hypothetical protein